MRDWIESTNVSIPESFQNAIPIHPIILQAIYQRGLKTHHLIKGYLDPTYYTPTPYDEFEGMGSAIPLLKNALAKKSKILIWGDFDVDGQTATTLLVSGLRYLGAEVVHYIPVRAKESHGLNIQRLTELMQQEIDLLITCDTGISSHKEVDYVRIAGVKVIITDHHELPDQLPDAHAIINSSFFYRSHPASSLPGVGVAYKLIEALYDNIGLAQETGKFLDLVALGSIADVAELVDDTRYYTKLGLVRLAETPRSGLQALYEQAGIDRNKINSESVSFTIAPRLNALGRLSNANKIVDFFTTQDLTNAKLYALELEALNARRKLLTDQVYDAAQAQINQNPDLVKAPIIILSHSEWPGGVIGIVASRLVDNHNKPVILIAVDREGIGRGSARSIHGFNITEAIARQEKFLDRFGGHPMAAGFQIREDKIENFRKGILRIAPEIIESVGPQDLHIDTWIKFSEIDEKLIEEIERCEPFGAGNPNIVFASKNLQIVKYRKIGRNEDHKVLTVKDQSEYEQEVIFWQSGDSSLPDQPFDLAYNLQRYNYMGRRGVQAVWIESRLHQYPDEPQEKQNLGLEVIDLRSVIDLKEKVMSHFIKGKTLIWCEGVPCEFDECRDRTQIGNTDNLIIYTTPPGRKELVETVSKAHSNRIVVAARGSENDEIESFLKHLAGLVKYILNNSERRVNLTKLAAVMGHRTASIQLGLEWLQANGVVEFSVNKDEVLLSDGKSKSTSNLQLIQSKLKHLLEETRAYRSFFLKSEISDLVLILSE